MKAGRPRDVMVNGEWLRRWERCPSHPAPRETPRQSQGRLLLRRPRAGLLLCPRKMILSWETRTHATPGGRWEEIDVRRVSGSDPESPPGQAPPPARSQVTPDPTSVAAKGGVSAERAFPAPGCPPLLGPRRPRPRPCPALGSRSPPPRPPAPPVLGPSPALPAALTAWKRGRRGEGREKREAARSRGRRHARLRDPTAQRESRAALPRASYGVRCPRPGARPEPRGRRDAAARDPQPKRGGGFRPGWAAAASERRGPRASVPGASRSPGPRRPPLCLSDSLPRSGPAALIAGLPVEWFSGPQRGETCPNSGAP